VDQLTSSGSEPYPRPAEMDSYSIRTVPVVKSFCSMAQALVSFRGGSSKNSSAVLNY
jgi:hypothetical protein